MERHPHLANQCKSWEPNQKPTSNRGTEPSVADVTHEVVVSGDIRINIVQTSVSPTKAQTIKLKSATPVYNDLSWSSDIGAKLRPIGSKSCISKAIPSQM